MTLHQYEVVIVNLDPTIGSEIKKTRPCVIVSPDEINDNLSVSIVAPLTSKSKNYPTRIKINFKGKEGWIAIDQIRTIDKKRIFKKTGKLTTKQIVKVKRIIKETLVD